MNAAVEDASSLSGECAGPPPSAPPERGIPPEAGELSELFAELRRLAHGLLQGDGQRGQVPTHALVLSALRRLNPEQDHWTELTQADRHWFFGCARRVMRQALVDYARARARRPDGMLAGNFASDLVGRWIDARALRLEDLAVQATESSEVTEAVLKALEELQVNHPLCARAVELKFYEGCSNVGIARELGVSDSIVTRYLRFGRTFIARRLIEAFPELKTRFHRAFA